MPRIYRQGRLYVARETSTYGTGSTTALPGITNGPLSGMAAAAVGAQAGVAGFVMPTISRSLDSEFHKHFSPVQVGRRGEDVEIIAGRRNQTGDFTVEVMPNSFGLLLFLATGADTVTPGATTTTSGAGNTANSTTLTVTASQTVTAGQRIFISDGANSEYVQAASGQTGTALTISGGGGTGGGLKFSHSAGVIVQFGPWSHSFTIVQASPGAGQIEENMGGLTTGSLLYKGMIVDALELNAPFENDTDVLTAMIKVLGQAPSSTALASSGPSTLPAEEISIGVGNAATFSVSGATSGTIYFPEFKLTLTNTARLAKAQVSSPDPYAAIGTNFHVRGTAAAIFEDFGVFQDFANTAVWNNASFVWTWPAALLQATGGAVASTLTLTIQRLGIEKAGKFTMKDDIVRLPIDAWRALDHPDYGSQITAVLKNNVAVY